MSSPPSSLATQPSSKVTVSSFIGLVWSAWAFTLPFLAFRIYVRIRTSHRLFWDDFLVCMACLLLLANAIIWQRVKTELYLSLDVQHGRQSSSPDLPSKIDKWHHGQLAAILFLTTSLWCVKLSFLIFFQRLGRNVQRQKIIWWSVFAVVVASYFVVLGTQRWRCLILPAGKAAKGGICSLPVQRDTFRAHCAIDIISDAIIILVPFNLLRQVRINMRQKLALAGIFSLTFFVMITAIIRVTVTFPQRTSVDIPWVWSWSSMEEMVAIVVACLASFRALFTQQDSPSQRIPEAKDNISGPSTVQGNHKTKRGSDTALRSLDKTSSIIIQEDSAASNSPASHHNSHDDTSSDVIHTPRSYSCSYSCSQEIVVQREFIVVSSATVDGRSHDLV